MEEQTDVDVNGLHEFESRTEDSTNSYGEEKIKIMPSISSTDIIDEVLITKITA